MISAVTSGAEDTLGFGARLGSFVEPGTVLSLSGSLGVGKTWLAKGIASAFLGVARDEITSPAFNLVHEYRGSSGRRVTHIDFYRLDRLNATDALLFEEYLDDHDAVVIVEWGERFLPSLLDSYLQVDIVADPEEEDLRLITLATIGGNEQVRSLIRRMEIS